MYNHGEKQFLWVLDAQTTIVSGLSRRTFIKLTVKIRQQATGNSNY
jgi:hypothetical protein